jgi:predicted nucleic acid-binding protein
MIRAIVDTNVYVSALVAADERRSTLISPLFFHLRSSAFICG